MFANKFWRACTILLVASLIATACTPPQPTPSATPEFFTPTPTEVTCTEIISEGKIADYLGEEMAILDMDEENGWILLLLMKNDRQICFPLVSLMGYAIDGRGLSYRTRQFSVGQKFLLLGWESPVGGQITHILNPLLGPNDSVINNAWSDWLEEMKQATVHIFDWGEDDPLELEEEWWEEGPMPADKCDLMAGWDYLISSPVDFCKGGEKAVLPLAYAVNIYDPYAWGITLTVVPLQQWGKFSPLPEKGGNFALRDCGTVGGYTWPYKYETSLEMEIEGEQVEFFVPSLAILEYAGKQYRLPEECLGWGEKLVWPKAEWTVTGVPTTTIEELSLTYGQFFTATIISQYTGDPSLLIEIQGKQFLLTDDIFVEDNGEIFRPVGNDPEEMQNGSGRIIVNKENWTGCFQYNEALPTITEWIEPSSLEGKYIEGQWESVCYDTLVTLKDGRGIYLTDGDVYEGGNYAPDQFEGFAHLESGSIDLSTQPRDPMKDARVMELVKELYELPVENPGRPYGNFEDVGGPIQACWDLKEHWAYIQGLSLVTVEWLCGPLAFEQRFAITSWGNVEMSPWFIGVSRVPMGKPVILTIGSIWRINFRTFVEVGGPCEDVGGIAVWVNQISKGEIQAAEFCIAADEYLFILPLNAYNPHTGAWWLPEDLMVFAIR